MFDSIEKNIKLFLRDEKNQLLNGKKSIFNNFSIIRTNDSYMVTLFNKYAIVNLIKNHIDEFVALPFYHDILELLIESKNISNINKVINICYFELVMFSLTTENNKLNWYSLPIIKKIQNKKFNRAKIFEINKSAIFFDKNTTNKKYQQILSRGFDLVEIPKGFSFYRLNKLTNEIFDLVNEKRIKNFNVSLRVKKLGLYQTQGFYSKETNTIFLDPRYLNVWRHELAHYYVNINNLEIENEEEFADIF